MLLRVPVAMAASFGELHSKRSASREKRLWRLQSSENIVRCTFWGFRTHVAYPKSYWRDPAFHHAPWLFSLVPKLCLGMHLAPKLCFAKPIRRIARTSSLPPKQSFAHRV